MNQYKLNTPQDAETLTKYCEKFAAYGDINVICGRNVVDGLSYLGIMALIGNEVTVTLNTSDPGIEALFNSGLNEMRG